MSVLKIEVARRQLGTPVAMFLEDQDPVSIHCLAGAASELVEHAAQKVGAQPFVSHVLQSNPHLNLKKIRALQRQYWNAFKHATQQDGTDRKDEELLAGFSDVQNDDALFIGWTDYASATKIMPVEAQAQQAWYIAMRPSKLAPEHDIGLYETLFPKIRSLPRVEQKEMLRNAIREARSNPDIMNHPLTDRRALRLSWPP